MNSKEFLHYYRKMSILKNHEISLEEAEKDIKIMVESMAEAIAMESELKLKNKGKFILADRKRKMVQNIHTGEKTELPPKKILKYIQPKSLNISEEK
ncbi:integration host factor subunit alpha [Fusobacterium sp. PH5-7]|uniref:HU family DNA-binding protein n=1 Tax=Fusobacterium sp. PH5-7 TaxID=2940528 RepID=UPI00247385BB|nr:HU family DNA-binding protein [Fusobacterium sp. PH5-7]MDH6459071.1 integration host factor subunit alpha [Fusobacterium sp. PH5-7]